MLPPFGARLLEPPTRGDDLVRAVVRRHAGYLGFAVYFIPYAMTVMAFAGVLVATWLVGIWVHGRVWGSEAWMSLKSGVDVGKAKRTTVATGRPGPCGSLS